MFGRTFKIIWWMLVGQRQARAWKMGYCTASVDLHYKLETPNPFYEDFR